MSAVALVYPHHLFKEHPALTQSDVFALVEDPLFFREYAFHKQKLAFQRAALGEYETYLRAKGKKVVYIHDDRLKDSADVFALLPKCSEYLVCQLDDHRLSQRLHKRAAEAGVALRELESPGFLTPLQTVLEALGDKEPFLMSSFYQRQRRCSGILMKQGKPAGGKWSFDAANRKRAPKDINIPALKIAALSLPARRALDSVERQFSGNPGEIGRLIYPVTFESAECWLTDFLERRLARYGDYQDAMVTNEPFLFHSVLSPLINCGLLTPAQVLQRSLAWGRTHRVPLNSLEGFVRQILGWREFMRGVYAKLGQRQRTQNFWGNRRRIPSSFWRAETGILPLDVTISRVLNYSYCHHIERLMVLGNFMLLCEFDPDEVYRWFMELFVDAYDWVMVPNVYGMSQYADGGLMTTKPYISSSNYIRKMSDFALGPWVEIWDGLFWRFINKHKEFFASNPRLSVMALQLKRLEKAKLSLHLKRAEAFLEALDG